MHGLDLAKTHCRKTAQKFLRFWERTFKTNENTGSLESGYADQPEIKDGPILCCPVSRASEFCQKSLKFLKVNTHEIHWHLSHSKSLTKFKCWKIFYKIEGSTTT